MNGAELQNNFYKRMGVSKNSLVFSKTGLLCTLLGHSEIHGGEFLSCTLSMGVRTAGRMLNCNAISLESTQTAIRNVIRINDLASQNKQLYDIVNKVSRIRPFGAELLYDCDIPDFFSNTAPLRISVLNCLLKIADCELDITHKAQICADGKNAAPYIAALNSRRDWCCCVRENKCEQFPLPLTGYRFLIVQTDRKKAHRRDNAVQNAYKKLRRIYPHILSIYDISYDMLTFARTRIGRAEYDCILHLLTEHERMIIAKAALTACRIKDFAKLVNESQKSIEKLWNNEYEHIFLANSLTEHPLCLCARDFAKGVYAIVESGSEDEIINVIRHDFNTRFGYFPHFCIADTNSTE